MSSPVAGGRSCPFPTRERASWVGALQAIHPAALVSLAMRLWLAAVWIEAGSRKVMNPRWMDGGEALQSYWAHALGTTPSGKPAIAIDWYRAFIQALYDAEAWTWFAPLVAWGELLVGIALLVGLFTGLAAGGSCLMNWSYAMAGTASLNMLMFSVGIPLVLAWQTAGWYGLDRWVLPALLPRIRLLVGRILPVPAAPRLPAPALPGHQQP